MREFYSTLDVSGICGVDPVTVARWCDRGDLSCYKTPGGHRRIRREELLAFLNKHGMEVPAQLAREGVRVLAVTDPRALAVLRRRYANHGGAVKLATADNLIEGLIQIGAQPPAVLLLDLDAPSADALAVCRQIRHAHAGIKVVALTSDKAKGKAAVKAGADAFLAKPLDLKALDALILPAAVTA